MKDDFIEWWMNSGSELYAKQLDEGVPMIDIIRMIFNAGVLETLGKK